MSAHASGQLARERARGWHTVAHQWRLPVATVPSAGLAVIKFRSWRSKNLTWQLEFSLDLSPQISFHRSVGVIFFWYVVQRRPLLDQADQLVFGFFGPDRHVLRIFVIFLQRPGWNRLAPCHARAYAPVPGVACRFWRWTVLVCHRSRPDANKSRRGETNGDGRWQCAGYSSRRRLTSSQSPSDVQSVGVRASQQTAPERVTTAEVRRHVMYVDIGRPKNDIQHKRVVLKTFHHLISGH